MAFTILQSQSSLITFIEELQNMYPHQALKEAVAEADLLGVEQIVLPVNIARVLLEYSNSIVRDIAFIHFSANQGKGSKIHAIKAIRTATRLGLKEAKDAFETEVKKLEDDYRRYSNPVLRGKESTYVIVDDIGDGN